MPHPHLQRLQKIMTDPETFTTPLLLVFTDLYGTEGYEWLPETIYNELADDLQVKLPQANFDRLMIGINLVLTDRFYKSLPDFVSYCNVLSGDRYDPKLWDPADAAEIAWGVTEAMLISPPDEENPFTPEIVSYIGSVLDSEGIINPPDVLKIAVRGRPADYDPVADYVDDPVMFTAIHEFEAGKTDSINDRVHAAIKRLAEQLDALPLRSGNSRDALRSVVNT